MATIPIIQVPIDDSEFQEFRAAWEDWQSHVKNLPADWQKVNAKVTELAAIQTAAGASGVEAWSKSLNLVSQYEKALREATRSQESLGKRTISVSSSMHTMAREAKSFAGHLKSALGHVAKFGAFMAGGSLLGLGGLTFGLDKLADSVLTRSRSARSLGITPGQLASFRLHMERVLPNPESVLQGAVSVATNPALLAQTSTLGINPAKAQTEGGVALAGQEIMAIHRAFVQNPRTFLLSAQAKAAQALGFSQSELQIIGRTPERTLRHDIAASAGDAGALGFSATVARDWSNFDIQLHRAGVLIESALIKALVPLAPELTKLSQEVSKFIAGAARSGEVKKWVDDLASGIKDFAEWIGSPQFKHHLKTFASEIGDVARGLDNALRFLGLIPREKLSTAQIGRHQVTPAHPGPVTRLERGAEARAVRLTGELSPSFIKSTIAADSTKFGVSSTLMTRLAQDESSFGKGKLISKAGALGLFQVMPQTARDFGFSANDMFDTGDNSEVAFRLMRRLLRKYHGDVAKAVAAYNWGPSNVDADIAKHGSRWLAFAPAETRGEVSRVALGAVASPPSAAPSASPRAAPKPPVFAGGSFAGGDGDTGARIRAQARAIYQSEYGVPPPPAATTRPAMAPSAHPAETVADVRDRYWQTHKTVNIHVDNPAGAYVHVGAAAAAAQ